MKLLAAFGAAVLVLGLPAGAQTKLSPAQFERDAAGTTLYFRDTNGQLSAEQYFPDRQVTLLHLGDGCLYGRWEPRGDQICFVYDHTPDIWHCWHYMEHASGQRLHRAIGTPEEPVFDLTIIDQDKTPLHCPGPAIGVSYFDDPAP